MKLNICLTIFPKSGMEEPVGCAPSLGVSDMFLMISLGVGFLEGACVWCPRGITGFSMVEFMEHRSSPNSLFSGSKSLSLAHLRGEKELRFFSLCRCPFVPAPFVERWSSSPTELPWHLGPQSRGHLRVSPLLGFMSCSINIHGCPSTSSTCLDYRSLIASQSGSVSSLVSFLLFQKCYCFYFQINFRISLSIDTNKKVYVLGFWLKLH